MLHGQKAILFNIGVNGNQQFSLCGAGQRPTPHKELLLQMSLFLASFAWSAKIKILLYLSNRNTKT